MKIKLKDIFKCQFIKQYIILNCMDNYNKSEIDQTKQN